MRRTLLAVLLASASPALAEMPPGVSHFTLPNGMEAVVIGRSNIVGKPMAQLLLGESCTVTIAHSRTRDLPALCRTADILIAAVGRPEMIRGDWIKPGATVIDVGINRITKPDGKGKLVGEGTVEEFVNASGASTVEVVVDQPEELARLLHDSQAETSFDGEVLRITGLDRDEVGQLCFDHRIRISSLEVKHPSLEDAFLGATADHLDYRSA